MKYIKLKDMYIITKPTVYPKLFKVYICLKYELVGDKLKMIILIIAKNTKHKDMGIYA